MAEYMFPNEITKDYLEQLAERVTFREAQFLVNTKTVESLDDRKTKIESQVESVSELLAQYTEDQYVSQDIEIMPGLKASFRTLIPQNMDDALVFANEHSTNQDNYTRVLNRIRLAYGLESINGKRVGEPHFPGSYFDAMSKFDNIDLFMNEMRTAARTRFNHLCIHGLAEKIAESYGLWETIVWERINGINDFGEVLKKSTGGSGTGQ